MPLSLFPDDIIAHYNLLKKVLNGFVYMEIHLGMYGLPQAGILANKLLKKRLACHGSFEVPHMPGLWKHISRPVWFYLCVNYIGIKYFGEDNLKHLFASLQTETYNIVEDWKGNLYCGITLNWNYAQWYVDIDMSKYVWQQLVHKHTPNTGKATALPLCSEPYHIREGQSGANTAGQQPPTQCCRQEAHPTNCRKFPILCTHHQPNYSHGSFGNHLPEKQPHRRNQRTRPPIS